MQTITRGPAHVVRYLSRYVHRIALANSRVSDYGHNATKHRTVTGQDFARLFLQHVLPPRFVRIRHYGPPAIPDGRSSRVRF